MTLRTSSAFRFLAIASFATFGAIVGSPAFAQTTKIETAVVDQLETVAPTDKIRVIVEFSTPAMPNRALKTGATLSARQNIVESGRNVFLNSAGFRSLSVDARATGVKRTYDYVPFVAFEGSRSDILALGRNPNVKRIVIDALMRPTLLESTAIIDMPQVWALGHEGAGQTVAILDTGMQTSHPFFGGRVIAEACFSSNVPADLATTVCPNGLETQTGAGAGVNCSTAIAGCDHGTHVAGIAAGNEGSALDGVARGASILAIQVFSRFDSPANCGGLGTPCALSYISDQIAGLDHVLSLNTQLDIASVNMSLGGGQFTAPCPGAAQSPSIDNLDNAGIAVVVASGNNGYTNAISSPACAPNAISVGSTTDFADNVSTFSNSATFLDLLAPGEPIQSSVPTNGFGSKNGTSMATPHVAGAFAVLKAAFPNASVDTILAALKSSGQPVNDTRNSIVKPRINVNDALTELQSPPVFIVVPLNGFTLIPVSG